MASPSPSSNRRQHFRLRYPESARPPLIAGTSLAFVTELSESGMRVDTERLPNHSGIVRGRVHLVSGQEREFQARIDRRVGGQLVLVEVAGIDLADLVEEQRELIRRFPRT